MALNRSFLFTPGNVPRRVDKAFTLEADVVIVDLEDSVAISDKEATRKPVAEALARPRKGRGYVRVNAPSSRFCYGDLVATVHKDVDGVLLPKVESAADLHAIDWLIAALERERGMGEGSIDLMPQVETAAGVQRVDRILQARSLRPYAGPWRVKRVAFGAADYAHELGLSPTLEEAELADARALVCVACATRAAPWKTLAAQFITYPTRISVQSNGASSQIGPVNRAYLPSDDELARAERIVAAFKEAEARGAAAIQVDGQMIDYPVVYRAQAVIDAMRKARARKA